MANKKHRTIVAAVAAIMTAAPLQAGKYQNFKVSTYVRAQDVARMTDDKFLKSTWETVSSQVDLDKIYLETHRDAFTVPEKTLKKVKLINKYNYYNEKTFFLYTDCHDHVGDDCLHEQERDDKHSEQFQD